jgi:Fic family protein
VDMPTLTWTDRLGRSYSYQPHEAAPIADAEINLAGEAVLALSEATRSLGQLPELPRSGIAAVLYRSESAASSIIEGIAAGPRRVLEAEFAGEYEIDDEIGKRVVSNLEGLRDATATPWPATSTDLLRWHRMLTTGHPRMRAADIGKYRTEQNWIGGDDSGPRRASFIPPAPAELEWLIEDLVAFCSRTDIAPLLQALIAHARFEVIHPFVDGNGRVGRMLLQHVLVGRAGLARPLPLSVPWSRNPAGYIAGLQAYESGDLGTWVETASGSVIEAVEWTRSVDEDIGALLSDLAGRSGSRGNSVASRIIADLPAYPLLDGPTVAERYGVSPQAAQGALKRLEQKAVLTRRSLVRRSRPVGRPRQVYSSTELIDLLERLATL